MKVLSKALLIATAMLWLAGCSSIDSRSQKLALGMSRADATQLLGSDYSTVAARVEPDGSRVGVLKYELKKKQPLFLYFREDKLVQWGDASVLSAIPDAAQPK